MPRPRNPDKATQAQQRLEQQFGMTIRELITRELELHRYQRNLTTKIAYRLGINPYTLTN